MLSGDQRQLRPYVGGPSAREKGLGTYLFESLFQYDGNMCCLCSIAHIHRSAVYITNWFTQDCCNISGHTQHSAAIHGVPWDSTHRFHWIHVRGDECCGDDGGMSNIAEADAIFAILWHIDQFNRGVGQCLSIGVICAYDVRVRIVRQRWQRDNANRWPNLYIPLIVFCFYDR